MKFDLRKIFNKKRGFLVGVLLLVFLAGGAWAAEKFLVDDVSKDLGEEQTAKKVDVREIDFSDENKAFLKTSGAVVPEAKVDVVAMANGTIRNVNFEIGDEVGLNQTLASIKSSSVLTGFSNSQTNYNNMRANLEAIERVADENIRRAEIGVQTAAEAVESAKIGLESAEDNLKNALILQEKNKADIKENAVTSFDDYLNFINNALDDVNYIIHADESSIQISGISDTLSVKNQQSLISAKQAYRDTRNMQAELNLKNPTAETIKVDISEIISALTQTKTAIDYTIEALDNSIPSVNFPKESLNAQRSSFSALRSLAVNTKKSAQSILNGLQNIELTNTNEVEALKNAVRSAQSRLDSAVIGHENAISALEAAKASKEQQLSSARSSLDSAQGQLQMNSNHLADLSVKAPISGEITGKFVEMGTEVAPGQKVAEVSKLGSLKVEVSLASEDVYRLEAGQKVYLGPEKLEANISNINSVADPITKKVKIEIFFDNNDKKLIPGTFVDVEIPLKELAGESEKSVFVPLRALIITQNESFVFVAEDGQARKRQVQTGATQGAYIEIVSGLEEGDKLIVDGAKSLNEGEAVEVELK